MSRASTTVQTPARPRHEPPHVLMTWNLMMQAGQVFRRLRGDRPRTSFTKENLDPRDIYRVERGMANLYTVVKVANAYGYDLTLRLTPKAGVAINAPTPLTAPSVAAEP